MDETQYKDKLKRILEKFESAKKEIAKEYAFSNAEYSVGDIVTGQCDTIKIEKLKYTSPPRDLPEAVYWGACLKKNGTPRKDGKTAYVYQSNIRKGMDDERDKV